MRRPIYNFAIDPELLAALRHVKARDGISESEQIRRGIRLWLKTKGVMKSQRKRTSSQPRTGEHT
jgi:hypothetical protein